MTVSKSFELRRTETGPLSIAYADIGPQDGDAIILLHGFPYDIHSFSTVVPLLTGQHRRLIVPYLRGHGTTVASSEQGRSGQQAALGADVVQLMDALGVERALFAGYDWGGRAACVAGALWPERCRGIVSVNGYLIQDIARAQQPVAPAIEAGFWYFFYFATERGRAGLEAHRREIARTIWMRNSPLWNFSELDLDQASEAFMNPDYVDVVVHSYRHRLGLAPGYPEYAELERRLATLPSIACPAVTLDGEADGNFPATDGTGYSHHFTGAFDHHVVARAGHNLPGEAPEAFVNAIQQVERMGVGGRK